jgi:CTP-dependent riboflavin kinase
MWGQYCNEDGPCGSAIESLRNDSWRVLHWSCLMQNGDRFSGWGEGNQYKQLKKYRAKSAE